MRGGPISSSLVLLFLTAPPPSSKHPPQKHSPSLPPPPHSLLPTKVSLCSTWVLTTEVSPCKGPRVCRTCCKWAWLLKPHSMWYEIVFLPGWANSCNVNLFTMAVGGASRYQWRGGFGSLVVFPGVSPRTSGPAVGPKIGSAALIKICGG